jgi:hypothetical protein
MPVIDAWGDNQELVKRYHWPAQHVTPNGHADRLRAWRKQHIADQEDCKAYKEGARHFLKLQRACTLMIPWFGVADSKQQPVPPHLWPVDLAPQLDEISFRILLADYEPEQAATQ